MKGWKVAGCKVKKLESWKQLKLPALDKEELGVVELESSKPPKFVNSLQSFNSFKLLKK